MSGSTTGTGRSRSLGTAVRYELHFQDPRVPSTRYFLEEILEELGREQTTDWYGVFAFATDPELPHHQSLRHSWTITGPPEDPRPRCLVLAVPQQPPADRSRRGCQSTSQSLLDKPNTVT